jgi:hypothetical protein
MTADDLLTIYIALIRSVLEYCCPVWHTNLPFYLSEQIERLQKRVLRIISQSLSYREALSAADCVWLDDSRQRLCLKLISSKRLIQTAIINSIRSYLILGLANLVGHFVTLIVFQFLNVVRTDLSAVFSQR